MVVDQRQHHGRERERDEHCRPRRPAEHKRQCQRGGDQGADTDDLRQTLGQPGLESAHVQGHERGQQADDQENRRVPANAIARPQTMNVRPVLFFEQRQLPFRDRLAALHDRHAGRIALDDRLDGAAGLFPGHRVAADPLDGLLTFPLGLRLVDDLEIDADAQVLRVNLADAVRERHARRRDQDRDADGRDQHGEQAKQDRPLPELRQHDLVALARALPAVPLAQSRVLADGTEHVSSDQ